MASRMGGIPMGTPPWGLPYGGYPPPIQAQVKEVAIGNKYDSENAKTLLCSCLCAVY